MKNRVSPFKSAPKQDNVGLLINKLMATIIWDEWCIFYIAYLLEERSLTVNIMPPSSIVLSTIWRKNDSIWSIKKRSSIKTMQKCRNACSLWRTMEKSWTECMKLQGRWELKRYIVGLLHLPSYKYSAWNFSNKLDNSAYLIKKKIISIERRNQWGKKCHCWKKW